MVQSHCDNPHDKQARGANRLRPDGAMSAIKATGSAPVRVRGQVSYRTLCGLPHGNCRHWAGPAMVCWPCWGPTGASLDQQGNRAPSCCGSVITIIQGADVCVSLCVCASCGRRVSEYVCVYTMRVCVMCAPMRIKSDSESDSQHCPVLAGCFG